MRSRNLLRIPTTIPSPLEYPGSDILVELLLPGVGVQHVREAGVVLEARVGDPGLVPLEPLPAPVEARRPVRVAVDEEQRPDLPREREAAARQPVRAVEHYNSQSQ